MTKITPTFRSLFCLHAILLCYSTASWADEPSDQIPSTILARAAQSKAPFYLVTVGTDGFAHNCHVLKSSGSAAQDALVCHHYTTLNQGISLGKDGQPIEYLKTIGIGPGDIATLRNEEEIEARDVTTVRELIYAFQVNDTDGFNNLLINDAHVAVPIIPTNTQIGSLDFSIFRDLYRGCSFASVKPVYVDIIAVETKCSSDEVSKVSHFLVKSGKVVMLYAFRPPIMVLKK